MTDIGEQIDAFTAPPGCYLIWGNSIWIRGGSVEPVLKCFGCLKGEKTYKVDDIIKLQGDPPCPVLFLGTRGVAAMMLKMENERA